MLQGVREGQEGLIRGTLRYDHGEYTETGEAEKDENDKGVGFAVAVAVVVV